MAEHVDVHLACKPLMLSVLRECDCWWFAGIALHSQPLGHRADSALLLSECAVRRGPGQLSAADSQTSVFSLQLPLVSPSLFRSLPGWTL